MTSQTNMKRWSDAKLAKEIYFANAARDDGHPENLEWLAAVAAEGARRGWGAVGDPAHDATPQTVA